MSKRRLLGMAAVVAALAAVAGPAFADGGWLDSIMPGTPVSTKVLSAQDIGTLELMASFQPGGAGSIPVPDADTPALRRAALRYAGLSGIRLIGQVQGFVFYAFDFKNNRHCYDAVHHQSIDLTRVIKPYLTLYSAGIGHRYVDAERSLEGAEVRVRVLEPV